MKKIKTKFGKNDKTNVLRETFGTVKFKRPIKQLMRETDKEL